MTGDRSARVTFEPLNEERSVIDAIINVLEEAGVRYVLGMSGGYVAQVFAALADHPVIRSIQVRQEAIATTMCEAYGRLTGGPIVVMGQGEWIVANAGQGVLEALLGCSPVVVLTEMSDHAALSHHGVYQSGSADYGAWDVRGALQAVTKRVMVSHFGAQAVQHTQLAFKHACSGEPGPVAVVYHSESLRGTVGPDSVPRIYPTAAYLPRRQRAVDESVLGRVTDALQRAQRPVIVAGNGVRVGQARSELMALSRAIDAPVATTAGGKGVYPETDATAVGVIGVYGSQSANAVVGDADVVLAVGTKLAVSDTGNAHPDLIDPSRQTLIQVEVEPLNASWTYPVDHVLLGDARYILDRLTHACGELPVPTRSASAVERARAVSVSTEEEIDSDEASTFPVMPHRLISLLQEAAPRDVIVTTDAGENRLFMMHWFRTPEAGDYLQPAGGGGMGYAISAALGAKLAYPSRPVVAVCGDGGFSMSIHALMTAVNENIPIGVVVFNNNVLGWSMHGSRGRVGSDFGAFDLASIAKAVGCDAQRVTSLGDLPELLRTCMMSDRPFVLDVPTSTEMSFRDVRVMRPLPEN
jgi:acetolactate synthase-1/2/3 large subunit